MTAPAPGPANARSRPRLASAATLLPWAVLLAAVLVFRIWGLRDGPGYGARDEMNYVPKAVRFGGGDLNPHYFQNPPLTSYLMFAGLGVRFLWGRLTGEYASSLDFKARFLAGDDDAFVAARGVVLLLALVSIVQVAALAREAARGLPDAARRRAGLLAAVALAASALHIERSSMATNDLAGMLAFAAASQAAFVLARAGTIRAAIVAGLLAGVSGGTKYTGAVACAAVGVAALAAEGRSWTARWRLAFVAGGASVAGFLVVCPWAVLDGATFRAHVTDLMQQGDRWLDGQGWRRYLETLWGPGLGPAWSVLAAAALAVVAWRAVRPESGGVRDGAPAGGDGTAAAEGSAPGGGPGRPWTLPRATAIVALACVLPLSIWLFTHTRMANGRYLLPVYPALVAIASAELVRRTHGRAWPSRLAVAAALVPLAIQAGPLADRIALSRRDLTQDRAAAWIRANVPDGAHVVTDWHAPRLPAVGARREFEGRVSPETWKQLVPGYRLTTAFDYFALPVSVLEGTSVSVDDLPGLRAHAPVWFVESQEMEAIFSKLPAGEYPPLRWYAACRALPVVQEFAPGGDVRGPPIRVRVLR